MHSILEITGRGSIVALYVDSGYDRYRVEMSPEACYPSVHKCPAHEELLQPCDLHLCKTSGTRSML